LRFAFSNLFIALTALNISEYCLVFPLPPWNGLKKKKAELNDSKCNNGQKWQPVIINFWRLAGWNLIFFRQMTPRNNTGSYLHISLYPSRLCFATLHQSVTLASTDLLQFHSLSWKAFFTKNHGYLSRVKIKD